MLSVNCTHLYSTVKTESGSEWWFHFHGKTKDLSSASSELRWSLISIKIQVFVLKGIHRSRLDGPKPPSSDALILIFTICGIPPELYNRWCGWMWKWPKIGMGWGSDSIHSPDQTAGNWLMAKTNYTDTSDHISQHSTKSQFHIL